MQESSHLSADDPEMAQLFSKSLQLNEDRDTQKAILEEQECLNEEEEEAEEYEDDEDEEQEQEEEEEEEEFSFFCDAANTSPIAAEDAFVNGQIRPIYPLFNQDLLLQESDFGDSFPMNPQVKKVFVEMKKDSSSASPENEEISGPYCEFSKKQTSEPEGCKKSNSTGFSKLWRFKDFLHRSNSDGRDAFVFLNSHETTSSGHQTVSSVGRKEEQVKVKKGKEKEKVKKIGKKKTTSLSAHEVYLKNKAKENDRKKSYLPYRPEVFGFFTNVNGGMSKNVHPF